MGDTPETVELVAELRTSVNQLLQTVIHLLPGAAHIVVDVGLINDAMLAGEAAKDKADAYLGGTSG